MSAASPLPGRGRGRRRATARSAARPPPVIPVTGSPPRFLNNKSSLITGYRRASRLRCAQGRHTAQYRIFRLLGTATSNSMAESPRKHAATTTQPIAPQTANERRHGRDVPRRDTASTFQCGTATTHLACEVRGSAHFRTLTAIHVPEATGFGRRPGRERCRAGPLPPVPAHWRSHLRLVPIGARRLTPVRSIKNTTDGH